MKKHKPESWFYADDPISTLPNGSAGYVSDHKTYDRPPLQFPGVAQVQQKPASYAGKAH